MEGLAFFSSGVAKPWQGRTLEGSGGSAWVLRGNVVTFGLKGRETVAGAYSRGLWRQRRAVLDHRGSAWKGRHFWSQGSRNRGRGVL